MNLRQTAMMHVNGVFKTVAGPLGAAQTAVFTHPRGR